MRITIKIYTSSSLDLDTYTASHYNISGVDPSTLIWSCSPRLVTRDIAQEIASFSVAYPAYTGYWRSGIANPVLASYINCRLNTLGTLLYFSHGFLRVVIFLGICTYWSGAMSTHTLFGASEQVVGCFTSSAAFGSWTFSPGEKGVMLNSIVHGAWTRQQKK